MRTTALAALTLSVVLLGCDGHSRRLYLSQQATGMRVSSAEASISIGRIEEVALSLGLFPVGESGTEWTIRKEGGSAFSIVAVSTPSGEWDVLLQDWPSFVRSDLSQQAERLLKQKIRNEN